MSPRLRHPLAALGVAVALTLPWVAVWAMGVHPGVAGTVAISGVAILGSSFLLAWAAETAEKDVPRSFALAVLAVLAVAPEYAVGALYAWSGGAGGATTASCADLATASESLVMACHDANLSIANMTGANRILIGIGWAGIAFFTVWQARRTRDPAVVRRDGFLADRIELDTDIALDIAFLFLATVWAFFVPLFGGIDALDLVILVGLYLTYILIVVKGDIDHDEPHVGVPAHLQEFTLPKRVAVVIGLFTYSGFLILTAVEPFAHGLEEIGLAIGVPSFFMIQWIAPLASESPELIVVAVLVYKARSTAGFNTLISSKLNQWTLLIGTLGVVYSIALGTYGVLPFEIEQAGEIAITAGQSFFALAILINFWISLREALALFVLFASQVVIEFVFLKVWTPFPDAKLWLLVGYTVIYLALGFALFAVRRNALRHVLSLAVYSARRAAGQQPPRPQMAD